MPHLSSVYTSNSDDLLVLGISYDALSSESELRNYARSRGVTFPLTQYDRNIVTSSYRITAQSSAVGIDASGVIRLRKGYGLQNASEWREWADTLTGS